MKPSRDILGPSLTTATAERQRIYLSGPISVMANFNRAGFAEAEDALEAVGFDVVNPLSLSTETDWHTCMRMDIKALMDCDAVATLKGWERSRGARIEISLATKLGMPVQPWQVWAGVRE